MHACRAVQIDMASLHAEHSRLISQGQELRACNAQQQQRLTNELEQAHQEVHSLQQRLSSLQGHSGVLQLQPDGAASSSGSHPPHDHPLQLQPDDAASSFGSQSPQDTPLQLQPDGAVSSSAPQPLQDHPLQSQPDDAASSSDSPPPQDTPLQSQPDDAVSSASQSPRDLAGSVESAASLQAVGEVVMSTETQHHKIMHTPQEGASHVAVAPQVGCLHSFSIAEPYPNAPSELYLAVDEMLLTNLAVRGFAWSRKKCCEYLNQS